MKHKKAVYLHRTYSRDHSVEVFCKTNNPKSWSRRVLENIRAQQGTIGEWAKFPRWNPFRTIPLDQIAFECYRLEDRDIDPRL